MNADRRALLRSIKVLFFNQAEVEYYSKLASVDLNTINYYIILITTPLKHFAALDYFHDIIKYLNLCYCGGYIPLHGLDKVIRTMKLLVSQIEVYLYIGGTSDSNAIPYVNLIDTLHLNQFITIHNEWETRGK